VSLDAHLVRSLGGFDLDVELDASAGEVVALLGPNGAGKTTAFRALAGLAALDAGHIELDGRCLDHPAGRIFVPPDRRPVSVVFQSYLLFPNLTALENVAFGLRARGLRRGVARRRASDWLERVGLTGHADHRPHMLSGGQAQRVALARALATEPRLLLLDEPLAALDAGTRGDVRRELRRHLSTFEGVRLLVTHDPVDAYALADRVVILEGGRVVQAGTLADVTAAPRSRYIADLVGVNLLRGLADAGTLVLPGGTRLVAAAAISGAAFAAIEPRAVALYRSPPSGSPRNVWEATVTDLDRAADRGSVRVRVRLDGGVPLVAEITPAALDALALRPGDRIWASVKATEVTTYPA
jgi:molybdate transport system ATP-binding protein